MSGNNQSTMNFCLYIFSEQKKWITIQLWLVLKYCTINFLFFNMVAFCRCLYYPENALHHHHHQGHACKFNKIKCITIILIVVLYLFIENYRGVSTITPVLCWKQIYLSFLPPPPRPLWSRSRSPAILSKFIIPLAALPGGVMEISR
jgi:hypothetical protein